MNTQQEVPILTRVLYVFGGITIICSVFGGGLLLVSDSIATGIAVISGGVFAGVIYIGIGQAVNFLAQTAFSTQQTCVILQTSISDRLKAIEKSSPGTPVAPTLSGSRSQYYYSTDGEQQGPVDATDLKMMRKDGLINDDTPVLREGETQWRRFRDYLALSR